MWSVSYLKLADVCNFCAGRMVVYRDLKVSIAAPKSKSR